MDGVHSQRQFSFSQWVGWTDSGPDWSHVLASTLFETNTKDYFLPESGENRNLLDDPQYTAVVERMTNLLRAGPNSQLV